MKILIGKNTSNNLLLLMHRASVIEFDNDDMDCTRIFFQRFLHNLAPQDLSRRRLSSRPQGHAPNANQDHKSPTAAQTIKDDLVAAAHWL